MEINLANPNSIKPLQPTLQSSVDKVENAKEFKEAYQDFVGKTFFGQMMKSMRSSVGKAAYFDGGRTEEVFRAQLDQIMTDHMSDATAETIAEPMFRQQFAQQAAVIDQANEQESQSLGDLSALRRR